MPLESSFLPTLPQGSSTLVLFLVSLLPHPKTHWSFVPETRAPGTGREWAACSGNRTAYSAGSFSPSSDPIPSSYPSRLVRQQLCRELGLPSSQWGGLSQRHHIWPCTLNSQPPAAFPLFSVTSPPNSALVCPAQGEVNCQVTIFLPKPKFTKLYKHRICTPASMWAATDISGHWAVS